MLYRNIITSLIVISCALQQALAAPALFARDEVEISAEVNTPAVSTESTPTTSTTVKGGAQVAPGDPKSWPGMLVGTGNPASISSWFPWIPNFSANIGGASIKTGSAATASNGIAIANRTFFPWMIPAFGAAPAAAQSGNHGSPGTGFFGSLFGLAGLPFRQTERT